MNEVACHGIPDSRPLEEGDILNIDVTIYHKGFHVDVNETVPIGPIDKKATKLLLVTREAQALALRSCHPGMSYAMIGNIIERNVREAGFTVMRNYAGHGIGRIFHANPIVPHYANSGQTAIMQPGQTFTIEPIVTEGDIETTLWPDEWTVVARDGKRSACFEDTVLVLEDGVEILTAQEPIVITSRNRPQPKKVRI